MAYRDGARPDAGFGALGEAVERNAASLPDPARIHWARIDALDGEVLSPAAFPLYAEAQYACPGFPYVRFDPGTAHPWVRGICLSTRQPVWVHAIMVYLSLSVRPSNAICQGSSNGLAAHLTWEEAACGHALIGPRSAIPGLFLLDRGHR
jgi:ribosomal protein S12 methylthiotransferase accessory factor